MRKLKSLSAPIFGYFLCSLLLFSNSVKADVLNISDDSNINTGKVLSRIGPGNEHVLQGIAIDKKNNWFYTLQVVNHPEEGVLNRFTMSNGKIESSAESMQLPSAIIGHQGFSVDPYDSSIFSSAGSNIDNRGYFIVRSIYSPNLPPSNISLIRVFDDTYKANNDSMPSFSPNGNKLVVRAQVGKKNVIRIYDIKNVKRPIISVENIKYKEWEVSNEITSKKYALQAITSSNDYIFLFSGGKNSLPKRIFVYDFSGQLIYKNINVNIGKTDALNAGFEGHWEPEGLAYDENRKTLIIAYAIGDLKNREAVIYNVNIK